MRKACYEFLLLTFSSLTVLLSAAQGVLEERLAEYNESHAAMDLVLFEQAMDHVCRIARVLNLPRGNAMLVSNPRDCPLTACSVVTSTRLSHIDGTFSFCPDLN